MEAIRPIDAMLVSHDDFGDSSRIARKVLERYRFLLELVAERVPGIEPMAREVLGWGDDEAARFLRDPVVQSAMEDAFRRLEQGALAPPDELERILPLALSARPDAGAASPTAAQMTRRLRSGPGASGIWLWSPGDGRHPLLALLRQRCEQYAGEIAPMTVCEPEARQVEAFDRACALLAALLPQSGPSALMHVGSVALVQGRSDMGRLLSASGGDIVPSAVFLDPGELGDIWGAAGRIFHESLHSKLFDIARAHALVAPDAGTLPIAWRNLRWSTIRVVFAFHVYVHMALYEAAVGLAGDELVARFGAPSHGTAISRVSAGSEAEARFGRAIDRARHLGHELSTAWADHLTDDGQRLVRWLNGCLASLDAPPAGEAARAPAGGSARALAGRSPSARMMPNTRYRQSSRLRARPLGDLGYLLVFTPDRPRLHWLNLSAWIIFELCDGRTVDDIRATYAEMVEQMLPPEQAQQQLEAGLRQLQQSGIIEMSVE